MYSVFYGFVYELSIRESVSTCETVYLWVYVIPSQCEYGMKQCIQSIRARARASLIFEHLHIRTIHVRARACVANTHPSCCIHMRRCVHEFLYHCRFYSFSMSIVVRNLLSNVFYDFYHFSNVLHWFIYYVLSNCKYVHNHQILTVHNS